MSSYISKNTNQIFDCFKNKKNMYIIGGIIILGLILFLSINKKTDNKKIVKEVKILIPNLFYIM